MVKGEMKGKRNEASQPRLDIIFSTSYAFSKNIFIDIGLDPDMYRDTSRTATGMDGTLPHCSFENLKPVEITKNLFQHHLNILKNV